MSRRYSFLFFSLTSVLAYLTSLTAAAAFLPQLIALFSLAFIILLFTLKDAAAPYINIFLVLIVNLIIFNSHGLNSPMFFLVYFLLFVLAFQYPPSLTLAYTLVLILLLAQSLNSPVSLISLSSLLFITPLVWFIARQQTASVKLNTGLSRDNTDILLWFSLNFKPQLKQSALSLQSLYSTTLTPGQRHLLSSVRRRLDTLSESFQKLTDTLSDDADE